MLRSYTGSGLLAVVICTLAMKVVKLVVRNMILKYEHYEWRTVLLQALHGTNSYYWDS